MKEARIYLPFPPSINSLYPSNKTTQRRFKSKKYKEWIDFADILYLQQMRGLPKFINPVQFVIYLGRPDKRIRDAANYEKAVSDYLVRVELLADDSLIWKNTQQWGSAKERRINGSARECVVWIRELKEES